MILNGKAKEDFEKWLTKGMSIFAHNMEIEFFNQKSEIEKNALIIEWFDSVGIYVEVDLFKTPISHNVYYTGIVNFCTIVELENTRQEATKQAIIKANEIYNNR